MDAWDCYLDGEISGPVPWAFVLRYPAGAGLVYVWPPHDQGMPANDHAFPPPPKDDGLEELTP